MDSAPPRPPYTARPAAEHGPVGGWLATDRYRSLPLLAGPRGEDPREREGHGGLQLIVAAVPGRSVRSPATELRGVAEAVALHVIVPDLTDTLEPQWLPRQILAPVPSAGGAGPPLAGPVAGSNLGLSQTP